MEVVPHADELDVPDPYFGEYGFDLVYNMLDQASDIIIENAENED